MSFQALRQRAVELEVSLILVHQKVLMMAVSTSYEFLGKQNVGHIIHRYRGKHALHETFWVATARALDSGDTVYRLPSCLLVADHVSVVSALGLRATAIDCGGSLSAYAHCVWR